VRLQDKLRCAIYIRVSTEDQAKEGYSLEAQEERLSFFSKSQDWNIYKIYEDKGYSAKDLNRPALKDLLFDIKLKRFDVILVYKIDRLSRKLKDLIEIVLKLNGYGIGIKSATEPIDTTTPAGRLIFHQLGSFAQYERELISERTKFGMMKRLKQGLWNGQPPYGYKVTDGKLEINPEEDQIVKKVFDLYVEKNMGVINIANELWKLGYQPRNSKKKRWKANTIHNILRNPIYIGKVRWGGEEAEGIHQPIVEKDIFEFVQGKLSANRTWTKRYESPNNFLGIVYCGLCKSPMHIHYPGNENKRRYKYYVCSQRLGYKTCDQEYIRADILEKSIIEELKNLSTHKNKIRVFLEKYKNSSIKRLEELEDKRTEISRKLKDIETERENLYNWVLKNSPTEKGTKFLNHKLEEIDPKENLLKKKLWETEDSVNEINTEDYNVEIITNYLENFVNIYEDLELGEKKLLLECFVKKVEIEKSKEIKLTLQIPLEKFRVFIPHISPKRRKTQNGLFNLFGV
jgi:site-specific DNA recombinase